MTNIDFDFLKPITELLTQLPGVAPRRAKTFVDGIVLDAWSEGKPVYEVKGVPFEAKRFEGLAVEGGLYGSRRVTPDGARLLVEMYERRLLPMKQQEAVGCVPSAVLAYIASEAELISRSVDLLKEKETLRKKHKALVTYPENVTEADFTYALLNDIFVKHKGPRSLEMLIGGVVVKRVIKKIPGTQRTNKGTTVMFCWTSSVNGEHREVLKDTAFTGGHSFEGAGQLAGTKQTGPVRRTKSSA